MKYLLPIILLALLFTTCRKQSFFEGNATIEFSQDTIFFDTVFTTVGSITEAFIVRNPYNESIKVTAELKNRSASQFRFNINGFKGPFVEDVEIRANDSVFVFVEVTVDPNGANSPLIIEEQLTFTTNGNEQEVELVAWGQDANFFRSAFFSGGNFVLRTDKPNVFYNYAFVDSGATLTIPAGADLRFHPGAGMLVLADGSLVIDGTKEMPVNIEGDRLELAFRDDPGQWDRIWLSALSKDNKINYANIKNGNIGVQVDSFPASGLSLEITNTTITNMSGIGIFGRGAKIEGGNNVFANCGQYCGALIYGGEYEFTHCTFANYWSYNPRSSGLLLLNNFIELEDSELPRDLDKANFYNSIFYGTREEEIEFGENENGTFNYLFDHCILRSEEDLDLTTANFNEVLNLTNTTSPDRVFNDPNDGDFSLFDGSEAADKGTTTLSGVYTTDILQQMRDDKPDLGAYEVE